MKKQEQRKSFEKKMGNLALNKLDNKKGNTRILEEIQKFLEYEKFTIPKTTKGEDGRRKSAEFEKKVLKKIGEKFSPMPLRMLLYGDFKKITLHEK